MPIELDTTIHVHENPLHSRQWKQCAKWILIVPILEIVFLALLGYISSIPNTACFITTMVLQVAAVCAIPVFYFLALKKKHLFSKIAYRTYRSCAAIHMISMAVWIFFYLISIFIPSTRNWNMLMWLPQAVAAYGILTYLLAIRPGKQSKYVTDLDVKMINDKAHLWIHRHKTYSDILDELVDQRYLFPVAELTTIRMGEGGDTLILEGNAKYMVWPFHMGDTPNYLADIKDTRLDPVRLVLHPKNDSENAKVAAFYNAIMQARSEL